MKNLRLMFSPEGKILRHMTRLRREVDRDRIELARLKALTEGYAHFGVPPLYNEDIEALENMIASREKELVNLQMSLNRIATEKTKG